MSKFKPGDRVVLARPDAGDREAGLERGSTGVVQFGELFPRVAFSCGREHYLVKDQLEPLRKGEEFVPAPPDLAERRERIATAVLAGFAAKPVDQEADDLDGVAAQAAVEWADALIAELDR